MTASLDTLLLADGERFTPATVDNVEYKHEGVLSRKQEYATSEGNCEVTYRRETDDEPDITVEGVVQKNQLDELKRLKGATDLKVITDVESNTVAVERLRLEQVSDLVSVTIDGNTELAFLFTLQMKVTG